MVEDKHGSEDIGADSGSAESPDHGEDAAQKEVEMAEDETAADPEPDLQVEAEPAAKTNEEDVAVTSAAQDSEPMASEKDGGSDSPSLAKRIGGVVAIIFGGLGVILSIVAIIAVWVVNTPITDTAVDLLVSVEGALDVVEQGLGRGDEALQTVRDGITDAAAQIPTEGLLAVVESVQSIVDSASQTADTASSVVGIANSIPFLGSSEEPADDRGAKLDELSIKLEEISTVLDGIEERLTGLSSGGVEGGLLSNIDEEIAEVQSSLNEAEGNVSDAGAGAEELQVKVPRWIDIASILISLLIIWMGIAQYSLLAHGWGWVRG